MFNNLSETPQPMYCLDTGIPELTDLLIKAGPGQLIAVAGRPGSGKSWLARNLFAQNFMQLRTSADVNTRRTPMPQFLYFGPTTTQISVLTHIVCHHLEADAPHDRPFSDFETQEQIDSVASRVSILLSSGMRVLPHDALTPEHIEGAVRYLRGTDPIALIVIDAFECLTLPDFTGTQEQLHEQLAIRLRRIAAQHGVTILVTTHVGPTDTSPANHPAPTSINESLFVHADTVLTVSRQCLASPDANPRIELGVAKPAISSDAQARIRASDAQKRKYSFLRLIKDVAVHEKNSAPASAHASASHTTH